jgi:hypothetical protein
MVRAVTFSQASIARRRPNQVGAWIRFAPVAKGSNHRAADRSWSAKHLQFLLSVRGWMRVPSVAQCVESLAHLGSERAITPRVFKTVLRHANASLLEFGPARAQQMFGRDFAMSLLEVDAFLASSTLSWQTIADYGASLAARSRRKHDYFVSLGQLMVLARSINAELQWTRPVAMPTFCGMCWRFTMTDRKYCPMHSPAPSVEGVGHIRQRKMADESTASSDTYWAARKLLSTFTTRLRVLRGVDRKHLLRSSWKVFVARGDMGLWLLLHRPHVYEAVALPLADVGPDELVATLVRVLDSVPTESRQERQARQVFHHYLDDDLVAVFEMVLRAEAWLSAAHERRSKWGGARVGAGRPTASCSIE